MATPLTNIKSTAGNLRVDRRFLLFQLDLKATALRAFGGVDAYTGQAQPDLTGSFKFIDPLAWEDPEAPLYWRNILKSTYNDTLNKEWAAFQKEFFAAVGRGDIDLREDDYGNPYRDVTDLVRQVSGYVTTLDSFTNELTLTLGPQDTSARQSTFIRFDQASQAKNSYSSSDSQALEISKADISENDVLMVRTSRNGGDYELEFLGFVTKVSNSNAYGHLTSKTLSVSGISKIFGLSTIIKQAAIDDYRFNAVNNTTTPSVLEHTFQGNNAHEIATLLFYEVMAWKEVTKKQTADGVEQNQTAALYRINQAQFDDASTTRSFQFNIFTLLTLYQMDQTFLLEPTEFQKVLFPSQAPATQAQENVRRLLDKSAMAVMEHGDHLVWNDTVASGFENFFSQTTSPEEIFGDLRSFTYYDVFEARDGTIILRPPRYNRIELSDSEYTRTFLTEQANEVQNILVFSSDSGKFVFNDGADFFIQKEMLVDSVDEQRDDMQLETRSDAVWTMPYTGPVDFPAGAYQDTNLLIKYGMRTKGVVNNPNVTNDNLAALYAPVVLGMLNAKTRRTNLSVRDTQVFRPGKLYYLEASKQVALLVSDEIVHGYGGVSKHNLAFNMVRNVVDIKISDIQKSTNLKLNFALMYLKDPAPIAPLTNGQAASMKKELLARADAVLSTLSTIAQAGLVAAAGPTVGAGAAAIAESAKNDATIPMFRYVPTILDVIVDIDDTPALAKSDKTKVTKKEQAAIDAARRDIGVTQVFVPANHNGRMFATELPFTGNTWSIPVADLQEVASFAYRSGLPDGLRAVSEVLQINWGEFHPREGIEGYGDTLSAGEERDSSNHKPYFIYNSSKRPQPLISTPFFVNEIAENPADFKFSQVLLNKLAVLDLTMKYDTNVLKLSGTSKFKDYLPNVKNGFPQYYVKQDGASKLFTLFGSFTSSTEYCRNNSEFGFKFYDYAFNNKSPNTLFLDPGATVWSSPCFTIPSTGSSEFNMPYGHLMYKEYVTTPNGTFHAEIKFIVMNPGRYKFTYAAGGNGLKIDAMSQQASLYLDDAAGASAALSGTPQPPSAIAESAATAGKTIQITTGKVCFLSPFLEPTVERLLELGLPPALAGYRKNTNTKELALKSKSSSILGVENDAHNIGQGIDLCVEALIYYSQADINIVGTGTTADEVDNRFAELVKNAGFVNDPEDAPLWSYLHIQNLDNITIGWKYPDGTDGGGANPITKSPAKAYHYYHLGVTKKDVDLYKNRVLGNLAKAEPSLDFSGGAK